MSPNTDSSPGRVVQGAVGAALSGFAAWVVWRNLSMPTRNGWIFWVPITLWVLTMSVLCWWSALSVDRAASRVRIQASWRLGWIGGAIGLAVGFVGPLVLSPEANLGPLLGILVTGPLGFVAGGFAAGVVRRMGGRAEA